MPYLSLPTLKAHLEARGRPAIQIDLNIACFEAMTTSDFLERHRQWVERTFEETGKLADPGPDDRALYNLCAQSLLLFPEVEGISALIEEGYRRGVGFYDIESYGEMKRRLRAFFVAVLVPLSIDASRWSWQSTDLVEAARDGKCNVYVELFDKMLATRLGEIGPGLVGISVVSVEQLLPAFTAAASVRRFLPDAHIVMGGPYITKLREKITQAPSLFTDVDSFTVFDGERPLAGLAEALAAGGDPAEVKGLIQKNGDEIDYLPDDDRIAAADLARPSFEGLPLDRYLSPEPVLPYGTSRGCYWRRCAFCNVVDIEGEGYREGRAERVADDLEALSSETGAKAFYLVDNVISPKALGMLSEELRRKDCTFRWIAQSRLEPSFTADLASRVEAAGCTVLLFGLETGSQRVLDAMGKGIRVEDARRVIDDCVEVGIAIHMHLILGFPTERCADAAETLDFLEALILRHPRIGFSSTPHAFMLESGSLVHKRPGLFGIIDIIEGRNGDLDVLCEATIASGADDALGEMHGRIEDLGRRTFRPTVIWTHQPLYALHGLKQYVVAAPAGVSLDMGHAFRPRPGLGILALEIDGPGADRARWLVYGGDPEEMFEIGRDERAFIESCDGSRTLGEVIQEFDGRLGMPLGFGFASLLVEKGALELVERPPGKDNRG